MHKGFSWTSPGRRPYQPAKVPAMWRRVADRADDPDGLAHDFGHLTDTTIDTGTAATTWAGVAERVRQMTSPAAADAPRWLTVAAGLRQVADLWIDDGSGIYTLPASLSLSGSPAVEALELELRRCAAAHDFRVVADGLGIVAEAVTLRGFLWLSAAEAVRTRHRFRRCDRCTLWFPVKRTDAMFCSATCRNFREKG